MSNRFDKKAATKIFNLNNSKSTVKRRSIPATEKTKTDKNTQPKPVSWRELGLSLSLGRFMYHAYARLVEITIEDLLFLENHIAKEMETERDTIVRRKLLDYLMQENKPELAFEVITSNSIASLKPADKIALKKAVSSISDYVTISLTNRTSVLRPADDSMNVIRALAESIKRKLVNSKMIYSSPSFKKVPKNRDVYSIIADDLFNLLFKAITLQRRYSVLCRILLQNDDKTGITNVEKFDALFGLARNEERSRVKQAWKKAVFLIECVLFIAKNSHKYPPMHAGDYFGFVNDEQKYFWENKPRPIVQMESPYYRNSTDTSFLEEWRQHVEFFVRPTMVYDFVERLLSLIERDVLGQVMTREIISGQCVDPLRVILKTQGLADLVLLKSNVSPADVVDAYIHKMTGAVAVPGEEDKWRDNRRKQWIDFQRFKIYFLEFFESLQKTLLNFKEEEEDDEEEEEDDE